MFGCHVLFSQKYWVAHHPNWRSHIFQRGGLKAPTRLAFICWLVVWNINSIFPEILGMSSSQLTKSYFSEGWLNHQPVCNIWVTHHPTIPANTSYDSGALTWVRFFFAAGDLEKGWVRWYGCKVSEGVVSLVVGTYDSINKHMVYGL